MSYTRTSDARVAPSPFELTNFILDDRVVEEINHHIKHNEMGAAQLKHYSYISKNIKRLEHKLDQHKDEQKEIFERIMSHEHLQ
jgi:hypothetical protein